MFRVSRVSVLFVVGVLVLLAVSGSRVLADGFIVVTDHPEVEQWRDRPPAHWGRRRPRPYTPLHVQSHHVDVTITDQVAVTTVDQVFFNHSGHRLEGTYIFPIPEGAQIDRFTMDINGVETEAELLEADKAREIYTGIVRSMRDPALLEYVGRGMFRMRIFPIEPHSPKRITLKYTQVLKQDGALIDYTYPLNTEKFSSRPIESLSMKVAIESSVPFHTAYSPTHTVELTRPDPRHAVLGFEASNALPTQDFTVLFARERDPDDPVGVTVLTHRPSEGADGYFMLIASPQAAVDDRPPSPKDIVFVVDTSGSMAGPKMRQAKEALKFCLANLNAADRFEIVRFSTDAETMFDELRPNTEENQEVALAFIDGMKPIGGTAIDDALVRATRIIRDGADEDRPVMVVFLTDGRPTIGETREHRIVDRLKSELGDLQSRFFCFGIGNAINTHLLDRVAEETRAVTTYVRSDENIEVKVSGFYERIDAPVLTNPMLSASRDVGIDRLHPRDLPDIFKGDQLVVLGRYSSDGDAVLNLRGSVHGETVAIDVEAPFATVETGNAFLPRMWATRRVGYLLDQIRLNGESEELRDEIVRLARRYSIVTPYTAYLIVEDEERRQLPGRMRTFGVPEAEWTLGTTTDYFLSMQHDVSGDAAVNAAIDIQDLRGIGGTGSAGMRRPDGPMGGNRGRAAGSAMAPPAMEVIAESSSLHVITDGGGGGATGAAPGPMAMHRGGRSFFFKDNRWVDSKIQDLGEDATVVDVPFGSDAYFELLDRGDRVAEWLSIGELVDVVIDGVVYRVTPMAAPNDDDATGDD